MQPLCCRLRIINHICSLYCSQHFFTVNYPFLEPNRWQQKFVGIQCPVQWNALQSERGVFLSVEADVHKAVRRSDVWQIKYNRGEGRHHHRHHRQPWAQCPLVSDAILTIAAHRCLSRAAWLNSCRVVPHHCSISSDHSRWGRPLLFEPSIIPNTRVFIFLLSFILQIWPKRRNFLSITFCSRVSAN